VLSKCQDDIAKALGPVAARLVKQAHVGTQPFAEGFAARLVSDIVAFYISTSF